MRKAVLSALLATMVFTACGGESPDAMLSSAKDYIAKNDTKAAVIQLKNALQENPNLAEARFLLGEALLEGGDPTSAEVELRKSIDLKYPSDQAVPLLARALLMLGQPRKVIDDLAAIPLSTPDGRAGLQTYVSQAYLMTGKPEEAKKALDAALAASPTYGPAVIAQARMLAQGRDFAGALALLNPVLDKSGELFEGWQLKGDLLKLQGEREAATAAYRKALEVKPDYLPAYSSLMSDYLAAGALDEASKQLDAMRKIAPKHPQTVYLQAQLFYRQKNFKAAQETLQQFLKALPDNTAALQLAGLVEYELKSYTMAENYLQKVLPKTPELGVARRALVATYLRNGQPAKALAVLEPVLGKLGEDSNLLALAGEVFMQNGDADNAETYYSRAAALDPSDNRKRTAVALSQLALGDTDVAYRELEQIASVDSGTNADLALIASQLKGRQFDQALKSIANLEKKQPENPLTHNLRATAMLGKSDVVAARTSLEKALALNPGYYPAAASLANLDLADKKPEEAKKRFEGVLAKDPNNVQAMLALAGLQARAGGSANEVAEQIKKALTANPDQVSPHLALIGLYLNTRDSAKALAAAQDALSSFPERAEVLDAAGRAQQLAGDLNQALATYAKLAAVLPNSPQPHLRMAEIHVQAKDKNAAMQSLRKALIVKSDSIEAQRGIMMLELDAGRTDDALIVARDVQKQRPKEAVGYILEGDVYALKKAWSKAEAVYRNGIKQSGATELAVKLHAVLNAAGSTREAEKFSVSWLKDHPDDQRFTLYLAEAANAGKNYAAASKYYRILVDAQPENAALLNNLAWSLGQIKDPEAIVYAERALKLAPDQPSFMDTVGTLLVAKGDMARGLELLQNAVAKAPQAGEIRLNLARALVKAGKKDEARKALEELAKLGEKFSAQAEVTKLLKGL